MRKNNCIQIDITPILKNQITIMSALCEIGEMPFSNIDALRKQIKETQTIIKNMS